MKMNEQWNAILNDKNYGKLLERTEYLKERWADESKYEDLQEYAVAIKPYIPNVIKMTSRPFGYKVKCDDGILHIRLKTEGNKMWLSATSTKVGERK